MNPVSNSSITKLTIEAYEAQYVKNINWQEIELSRDFSGADKIIIFGSYYDGVHTEEVVWKKEITDAQVIAEVVALLLEIPPKGDRDSLVSYAPPATSHRVVGYRDDTPFAVLHFNQGGLKSEGGAFFGTNDENIEAKVKRLTDLLVFPVPQ